ncbi:hypothetical protein D6777_04100 [Candidatus Woesearchaeota archaeon]|nr:MAG: hypothetical protein D6777_04100 [Candidatus Woesearchaeota archaeon]
MDIEKLISELKSSDLYAECGCGCKFKLKDVLMFDGTKPFPKEAKEKQQELKQELEDRKKALEKKKKLATEKAEITTKSVNIGKMLEKVLPTLKDFPWVLPDCRFIGNPIDLVNFNGISKNVIGSISFVEIKTGTARLKKNEKAIKDAVEDHRLSYKVIK